MSIEHCIRIERNREQIFAIYKDVNSWARWDPDVEAVVLEGEFVSGTHGWLKPVGAPKTVTRMVSVVEPSSFSVEAKLPFCVMRFEHELVAVGDATDATHRVVFSGFLAPLFSLLIGRKIQKGIRGTMEGLKQYAES